MIIRLVGRAGTRLPSTSWLFLLQPGCHKSSRDIFRTRLEMTTSRLVEILVDPLPQCHLTGGDPDVSSLRVFELAVHSKLRHREDHRCSSRVFLRTFCLPFFPLGCLTRSMCSSDGPLRPRRRCCDTDLLPACSFSNQFIDVPRRSRLATPCCSTSHKSFS